MQPKPGFLGRHVASAFQEESVAGAYQHRPPYPDAVFDILASLAVDQPRYVLDVGCGTGFLARRLVEHVAHVDAVDISPVMIERGRLLPNGDSAALTWIAGAVEDEPLNPPYALITAGDSLHWMEWSVVMPRFAEMLTPNGSLAILGVGQSATPWDGELLPVLLRNSTIEGYRPYDLVAELESRALFQPVGRHATDPVPFTQPLEAYIESFHGRASFSRQRMTTAAASAFDAEVRALVQRYTTQDVTLHVVTEVVWGKPLRPNS
jgi:SAM-dependent methyltransferase